MEEDLIKAFGKYKNAKFDLSEKKETKGSNLIQLRLSDKTKQQLEELAEATGLALNTYMYHLIAEKIEKKTE